MSREIPLTQGLIALVDDCDYDSLSKFKWHAQASHNGVFYACRWEYRKSYPSDPKKKQIKMHNQIMGVNPGLKVDHVSRDGCDNRRMNLRWATAAQNAANRKWSKPTKSGYKGVYWDRNAWQVMVQANGKRETFLRTTDVMEAAKTYDIHAKRLHGEFAQLNFPENPAIQGVN